MLIEKYKPEKYREILGQELAIRSINNWLDSWKPGEAILLHGPTGIGKTLIAEVIAKERKLHLLEINPSDRRSAEALKELNETLQQKTIIGKKIILIDEVDSFFSEDRGGVAELIRIVNDSKHPVIFTANNPFDQKLRPLRERCRLFKMRRVASNVIFKKLREISNKEKLGISDELLYKVSSNSKGDVRAAINDLEILATGAKDLDKREQETDIFEILKFIFKTKDLKKISDALAKSDKDLDELIWWVEHNIANEYEKKEEIAQAFEILSKADLNRGRIIKNQNYRFEKHARNLIAAISLVKKKTYYKFTGYRYPSRLAILGQTKQERMEQNVLLGKLSKELHCSKRTMRNQLLYLEKITGNFKDM